ncbi:MAG: PEGA domain-containing protein, partial [Dehalococcoidia bacterium]
MPLSFNTVASWRRTGPRRATRTWLAWGLAGLLIVAGGATLVLLRSPAQRGPAVGSATLHVESVPTGAAIDVDGHARGHTPTTVSLEPGEHRVTFQHAQFAEATYQINVDADQTTALVAELWLRTPHVQRLRPPFPGGEITSASFLNDGQVALVVAVPPGDERQLWLLDGRGTTRRLGPPVARGSLAVAPDGRHVAYLASQEGSGIGGGRLSEVWIARGDEERGERRYAFHAGSSDERLLDLSWDPTGRHVLIISRQKRRDGGQRSQFRLLDVASGQLRELASLPSEVVLGSNSWSPDGRY